ncbi:MAG: hypothetical protein AAB425_14225 [Bdellovibrionota bacterium]
MNNNQEERSKILALLASGKINADEAGRLIDAISAAPAPMNETPKSAPQFLRIVVEEDGAGRAQGAESTREPKKVNIRVPFQLLRAGIKLAAILPPEACDGVNRAFREKGIDLDLSKVKAGEIEEVLTQISGLAVDVDAGSGKRVRIFCE